MNLYKITVIVATYHPKKEKLLQTLRSIVNQKNVKCEIIITDDGSEENYFSDIEKYFEQCKIEDYVLLEHKYNQGTVKNILDAVKVAKGEYVKFISPGDFLYCEDTLFQWTRELEESGFDWSFGDSIYYTIDKHGEKKAIEYLAFPIDIKVYQKKQWDKCRWNYIALGDNCLGAATMIKRGVALKYLQMIKDKVVYGEDNIYYLMMFDGVKPLYYSENICYYEYGMGVSTSSDDKWTKILQNEWRIMCNFMQALDNSSDKIQKKIARACRIRTIPNKYIRFLVSFSIKGIIRVNLKRIFKVRKTKIVSIDIS